MEALRFCSPCSKKQMTDKNHSCAHITTCLQKRLHWIACQWVVCDEWNNTRGCFQWREAPWRRGCPAVRHNKAQESCQAPRAPQQWSSLWWCQCSSCKQGSDIFRYVPIREYSPFVGWISICMFVKNNVFLTSWNSSGYMLNGYP